MASLAAFPRMLERDRKCEGLRDCRAAWLIGVSCPRISGARSGKALTGQHYVARAMRSVRMAGRPAGMTRLMNDEDAQLRDLLRTLSPSARERLRDVLSRDQVDRDLIAARLLRFRDVRGAAWADLIDELSLDPELRRRCVRLLGELTSSS